MPSLDLEKFGEREAALSLPRECPYTIEQILAEDWDPEPANTSPGGDREVPPRLSSAP